MKTGSSPSHPWKLGTAWLWWLIGFACANPRRHAKFAKRSREHHRRGAGLNREVVERQAVGDGEMRKPWERTFDRGGQTVDKRSEEALGKGWEKTWKRES